MPSPLDALAAATFCARASFAAARSVRKDSNDANFSARREARSEVDETEDDEKLISIGSEVERVGECINCVSLA